MTRDRAAALVLLLLALGGAVEASRLKIGDPGQPGPGFFPFGLALALGLVAVALLLQAARAAPGPPAAPAETVRRGKAALALTASAAYAFALEPLGFVLTTFLLLLFLLVAIEARRWPSSLMIATATSLGSHLLFKVWLAVPLPAGPWGF